MCVRGNKLSEFAIAARKVIGANLSSVLAYFSEPGMRIRLLSALCVLLPAIYSPRTAVGQSNAASLSAPQASSQKTVSPGSSSEFARIAESGTPSFRSDFTNAPTNSFRGDSFRSDQIDGVGALAMHSSAAAAQCAHIVLYPAPAVDSKIIVGVPKEFASNMPVWHGAQPCCSDLGRSATPQPVPFEPRVQIGPLSPNPSGPAFRISP
jgi:hypothetical protein